MFALSRLTIAVGLSAMAASLSAAPLTLPQAERLALADSPMLAEIQARYDAAQQIPDQKYALPDPVLSLGIVNVATDTWDLDQEAMTQLKVGITQSFPWPSERKLAKSKALKRAKATEAELREARNGLAYRVRQGWWMLYFVDRALEVVEDNLQRLREFNRIAQSRYRVGEGLQQDVLQAQLQLSNQLDQKLQLQGKRRWLGAQLNSLMAQPEIAIIELPIIKIQTDYDLPSSEYLLDQALKSRPSIQQKQRMLEAARDNQALAEKGLLPDLTLGVSYGYRQDAPNGSSRADLASLMLGIKLPLYAQSKQHREISQRAAEVIAKKEALRAQQIKTRE
ncbi:MAG: TolC family protein, partial [Motiliproteus sp.]|nr:TolC family protein [Motiliproteus sp.]